MRHSARRADDKWGDDLRRTLLALSRYTRTGVRSAAEVRAYLRRRGVSAAAAARAVTEARARALVDDRAASRLWAEHWARRGYAWAAIRVKLSAKGFDDAAITSLERTLGTAAGEVSRARTVAAQYQRRSARRSHSAHLARALASRGFDGDVIDQILVESIGSASLGMNAERSRGRSLRSTPRLIHAP